MDTFTSPVTALDTALELDETLENNQVLFLTNEGAEGICSDTQNWDDNVWGSGLLSEKYKEELCVCSVL